MQRTSVQNALQGLCYGYPYGSVETPNETCIELYAGPDHVQMILQNRYFKYRPDPY